jgi:methylenetetrahydrofolate reductase (NADPH)
MLEAIGIDEVFVIAGDAAEAHGPYADSLGVIAELLERAPFLETIGVTGYPDGHPYIDSDALRAALHTKQQMFAAAGVQGYVATQMCFDPDTILTWLRSERAAGMTMPVQLGVAGVVDRAKLLTLGVRLGVGTSLRYLSKNRNAIGRLLSPGGYRPDQLLTDIESEAEELGITGLHLFTFNQVGTTAEWYDRALAQVRPTL